MWATYDFRLYSSSDNGASWQQVTTSGLVSATGTYFFYALACKTDGTTFMGAGGAGQVGGVFKSTSFTSVAKSGNTYIFNFSLDQNYPNPFNPSTTVPFYLPSRSFVSLKIFDLLGKEISTLVSEELSAGNYSRQWNAESFPSGVYFYRLQAGSFTETKKLLLLR